VTESVAAILLAAGKSQRMGRCKQVLPLGDTTVIGRCLETLMVGGISKIVVVVSPEGHEVTETVRKYPVRIAVNNDPNGDMAASVRSGRDALPAETTGVIVALCDYPLVAPSTVEQLVGQHYKSPALIIIPTHAGRRGHPVLFPRTVLADLTADLMLRDLIRRNSSGIYHVDVGDEGVLLDMDTPEDYEKVQFIAAGKVRRICDILHKPPQV
jgi:molybdenum cofactor cytidylyltransferase